MMMSEEEEDDASGDEKTKNWNGKKTMWITVLVRLLRTEAPAEDVPE